MKAKSLVTSLALAAALATTAGIGISYAADTSSTTGPMQNLVSAIASKFNLNEADVQAVFDEQRQAMETRQEEVFADHIAQGVTDGDITQEQANAIQDKRAELESLRDSLSDATEQDRHTAMRAAMDELHQWAIDNKIPEQYLPFGGSHSMQRPGFGHAMGDRHETNSDTAVNN